MRYLFLLLFIIISWPCRANKACDAELMAWDRQDTLSFRQRKSQLLEIITEQQQLQHTGCLADAYRRLGSLYKHNSLLDSAATAYIKAAAYAKIAHDMFSTASCYNQLGALYHELQNLPLAAQYFGQAKTAYSLVDDAEGMADAGNNLAEIQYRMQQWQQAENSCRESMQQRRRLEDTAHMGDNYLLLSRICLDKGDAAGALQYSETAIALFRKNNDEALLSALLQAATVCYRSRQLQAAAAYYREVYEHATLLQPEYAAAALGLSDVFMKQQQADSALYYLKIYVACTRFLPGEAGRQKAMELAVQYETDKKDMELHHQQQLAQDRLLLITVLAALALLLLVTIVIIKRNIAQRKKVSNKESEIRSMNAMLRGQDQERERIARELHDRVGSMLSTVKLHFSSIETHMDEWRRQQGAAYSKALELLDETYEEVRRISHDLDAGLLSRFGLKTAMLQLVHAIEMTNKLRVIFLDNTQDPVVYKAFETDLYRISQELLNNTIKYAAATEAGIQISRNQDVLVYSYEDDGKGFDRAILDKAAGMGFRNIEYRVQNMGGKWQLDTSPGRGMSLIIELPVHEQHKHYHSG